MDENDNIEVRSISDDDSESLNNDSESLNNDSESLNNDNESYTQEDEYIRNPDSAYSETLIETIPNFNLSDDNLELALRISNEEYRNSDQFKDLDGTIFQNYSNSTSENDDLELALELSNKEYIEHVERLNHINMEHRKKSLENFCKRIKTLRFSDEEKELKEYFELRLQEYFELKIDCDIIHNHVLYDKLFKYIDTLYLIPSKKDINKTAIPQEEDDVLRTIFLKA